MYAVIKAGGKQYRVVQGQTLKIETIAGEVGSAIVLDKVLAVGNGDHDFASHDLTLHVGVGVVFSRAVMGVAFW